MLKRLRKIRLKYRFGNKADFDYQSRAELFCSSTKSDH